MKKAKRYFNTSGPNRPKEHYTLKRESLVEKGIDLVEKERYFTTWAPRQTGKSTYINLLVEELETKGYKAKEYRWFVEKLLFTGEKQKFKINDEKIRFLYSHGLIRKDNGGYVEFWVPMYKKAVYDAFYPYNNGERDRFFRNVDFKTLFYEDGRLRFDRLIDNYKDYVKRRSFKYFREKDKTTGEYMSIKEAALAYSFETYIQSLVQTLEGKSYLEPHSGLGRCDLIINIQNREYVIEFKIFRDMVQFEKGKKQLTSYCRSISVNEGIYLVFVPNTVTLPGVKEQVENIDNIGIVTFIVHYDEEKDF